ncbi:MAG: hypothetical protein M3N49_07885 [Candidatus Eremiobacteraeota bacterium]|nr:hypothetical protein [Candidatus Eremiobacteraeota bacterium]
MDREHVNWMRGSRSSPKPSDATTGGVNIWVIGIPVAACAATNTPRGTRSAQAPEGRDDRDDQRPDQPRRGHRLALGDIIVIS